MSHTSTSGRFQIAVPQRRILEQRFGDCQTAAEGLLKGPARSVLTALTPSVVMTGWSVFAREIGGPAMLADKRVGTI